MNARSLARKLLRNPLAWAWALLSLLPPSILASINGWEMVDPGYVLSLLAWWPVDLLARLSILKILSHTSRHPTAALPPALSAEVLLGLRLASLGLLGLVPALALLAGMGLENLWTLPLAAAVGCLGLIPAFLYYLRTLLSPMAALKGPFTGAECLDESQNSLKTNLIPFLRFATPWMLASLGLEALGWALPGSISWFTDCLALFAGLLPLAAWTLPSLPSPVPGSIMRNP